LALFAYFLAILPHLRSGSGGTGRQHRCGRQTKYQCASHFSSFIALESVRLGLKDGDPVVAHKKC
jgi:hypothetical protein